MVLANQLIEWPLKLSYAFRKTRLKGSKLGDAFFNIIFMKLELRLIEDRMCLYNNEKFLLTQRYSYRTAISCTELTGWDSCCVM